MKQDLGFHISYYVMVMPIDVKLFLSQNKFVLEIYSIIFFTQLALLLRQSTNCCHC